MKSIFSVLAFLAMTMAIQAQGAMTLLTFESFTFADQFDTEYGYGKIEDGFQWGLGLEFEVKPGSAVELIYQRMNTEVYYEGIGSGGDNTADMGVNYILLGFTGYQPFNEVVSGFGTFDLGAGFTSGLQESLNSENVTRFALGGRLGVKIAPIDSKVSIRLHAQLLSPVQWFGGGFYFGTGGSGAGVSTGSTIWQFNLGGSVNYQIK